MKKAKVTTLSGINPEIKMSITQNEIVELMYHERIAELRDKITSIKEEMNPLIKEYESFTNVDIYGKRVSQVIQSFKDHRLKEMSFCYDDSHYIYLQSTSVFHKCTIKLYYTSDSSNIKNITLEVTDIPFTDQIDKVGREIIKLNKILNAFNLELSVFQSSKGEFKASVIKKLLNGSEEGSKLLKLIKGHPLLDAKTKEV